MRRNDGIIATGGSNVVGNAVASGKNAKAEVRDSGLTQYGDGRQPQPMDLDKLLSRLIDELGRSDHPERDDLIEAAEDAREEATSEEPRKGKLKVFARALVAAVPGFTALASLAVAIEEAIHGL
ncbi:hypothetical protein OHU45_08035 [Streptomyces tubercidicus]|uniref:Uncharacterized protein n=1 Tax=Streptomyces tubercidicus TaxID=47759 RepID=A0A640ULG4_9ACTN|nr:hypothetical protein [Streptomyces tubercidicus]WAU11295.1 hypothetical protein STRTU_001490 [Streptomyces tubercidicus]WSK34186.1 hypothetical protein OG761_07890 [Streptomyces tubercidicus]WSX23527.1 hypothetical protein OG690_29385 [Streptomyces tubercidicus]GFE36539.1 hypothetical protein Stube_12120 [Streptomyces tubercidicus]